MKGPSPEPLLPAVDGIAIIGMSGRFPGAADLDTFWTNLKAGTESISFFSDEELRPLGLGPEVLRDPAFVRARGILEGVERFDAAFFGYAPREAEILDPQHRLFLECAWEALEDAGCDPGRSPGAIGVFAGCAESTYASSNLARNPAALSSVGGYAVLLGNDRDFLATRVSYKLGLRGPALTVQSACSTSLVAVHLACQSLLAGECDLALAGGASVVVPMKSGYFYQQGGLGSPDGHCRPFDARAAGTVGGDGAGAVVLKPYREALRDGDRILAVIRGSAINNDGLAKAGFTAPSVDGQAAAIAEALHIADVHPETIGYVETHGTGTELGDPIELAALTQAFRERTNRPQYCALGALKANVGHLNAAAGVASLIKGVLALQHRALPPHPNFESPNPKLDLAGSPFYVNTRLLPWERGPQPRRAGISAFGIGGTNAHAVLEEAPEPGARPPGKPWQLLLLSARDRAGLDRATQRLAAHLAANPDLDLADVAWTLDVGRKTFPHRRMLVARDTQDAREALEPLDLQRTVARQAPLANPEVVFLFPGGGAQHARMGLALYEREPVFRQELDRCAELLRPWLDVDLRELLYRTPEEASAAALRGPTLGLPSLFAIEYALARLVLSWGIQPRALIGHSLGEYVAAHLAGVFSLEDALAIVVERGRLFASLEGGGMLSVDLPAEEAAKQCGPGLSLAAINGPRHCVLSGALAKLEQVAAGLEQRGVSHRRVAIDVAAHSEQVDPLLPAFRRRVEGMSLGAPSLPLLSNLTGTWLTSAQATDPAYWVQHLRSTVRFAEGMETLLASPDQVLLELGPGGGLTMLARQQRGFSEHHVAIAAMRHPHDPAPDPVITLGALGRMWLAGVAFDPRALHGEAPPRRVRLPPYPFDRRRSWIDPAPTAASGSELQKKPEVADWFYLPSWKPALPLPSPAAPGNGPLSWLLLADAEGVGADLAYRLQTAGHRCTVVVPGPELEDRGDFLTMNPALPETYPALLATLARRGAAPQRVIHLWGLGGDGAPDGGLEGFEAAQARGFHALLALARAHASSGGGAPLRIDVVASGVADVGEADCLTPAKATLVAACCAIPQELPHIACRLVDTDLADREALLASVLADDGEPVVALRGRKRWLRDFTRVRLEPRELPRGRVRDGGVYLITGGLGELGLLFAEELARKARVRLVLTRRGELRADGEVAERLRRLEASGTEVMTEQADVADPAQMRALLERVEARFGPINGVIHAAAVTRNEAFQLIADARPEDSLAHFRPKAHGLLVLTGLLGSRPLDFAMVTSSLASILGGLGFSAYAAANCFVDAFVRRLGREGASPWISVNWEGWRFGEQPNASGGGLGSTIRDMALTAEEGLEVFRRLLAVERVPQIAVCTGELNARLRQWVRLEPLRAPEPQEERQRPELKTEYVAPRNPLEHTLAELWRELLGLERIGVFDNFFELGGHSLLATRLMSRIRDTVHLELSVRAIFEAPTVAALAERIVALQELPGRGAPPAGGAGEREEFEL